MQNFIVNRQEWCLAAKPNGNVVLESVSMGFLFKRPVLKGIAGLTKTSRVLIVAGSVGLVAACTRPCEPRVCEATHGGGAERDWRGSGVWGRKAGDLAAWTGFEFHGRRTANGEVHDSRALLAAHPDFPLPSYARIRNLRNGREIVVRVNDRFQPDYRSGRTLSVSHMAARFLGFVQQGTAPVQVIFLRRAGPPNETSYEDAFLARQPWVDCDRGRSGEVVACWPPEAPSQVRRLRPAWR